MEQLASGPAGPGSLKEPKPELPARSLLEHLEGLGIEVTEPIGLEPVGDDPKQQIPGEMFGSGLAKNVSPSDPQPLQIEIAQHCDLVLD